MDTTVSERSADHTAGNKTEGCGCDRNRVSACDTSFLKNRSECTCGTMSADHRDGTNRKTKSRVEMESTGKSIAVGALEYHNTVEIYPQE